MKKAKVSIGRIRAAVAPGTYDSDKNTVEVVFATETPVRRYDWSTDRQFNEVLELSAAAVNLERLRNGAPVLNAHSGYDLEDVIGVVDSARIDEAKHEGYATLRLSSDPADAGIVSKIKDGIIRNISVGYNVSEYTVNEDAGEMPEYRATSWTPMEISFVPVPADPNSGTRASEEPQEYNEVKISNPNIYEMNKKTGAVADMVREPEPKQTVTTDPVSTPAAEPVNVEDLQRQAVEAERKRIADIQSACTLAKLTPEFAQGLISDGKNIDEARAAIIEEAFKQAPKPPVSNGPTIGEEDSEKKRNQMIEGLMERIKPGSIKDFGQKDVAREVRSMSFVDLGRNRLRAAGTQGLQFMDKTQIAKRAIATTDFPELFSEAISRTLRRDYANQVQPWEMIARRTNASDYRVQTGLKLDGKAQFSEIPEGGEYKTSKILQDGKATLQLKRFGQRYLISYETIVNDDLGALSRIPQMVGIDAQNFQSDKVWELISSNAKTPDGKDLFDASNHKNLAGTGAVLSSATLSAGRAALRKMTSPAGRRIGVAPAFLIVPPELETEAQQLISVVMATQTGNVNVFAGTMQVVVVSSLTDPKAWYLAADPNQTTADGVVYSYLDGHEGVNIGSYTDQDTDAIVIKASMSFDAKLWGFQGWYKNPGA